MRKHLAIVGITVMTGATLILTGSAASAQTTPNAQRSQAVTDQHSSRLVDQRDRTGDQGVWQPGRSRGRYIGTYRSRMTCHRIGRYGERRGWWDDYRCRPTWRGWALFVSRDRGGHGPGDPWGPGGRGRHGRP